MKMKMENRYETNRHRSINGLKSSKYKKVSQDDDAYTY